MKFKRINVEPRAQFSFVFLAYWLQLAYVWSSKDDAWCSTSDLWPGDRFLQDSAAEFDLIFVVLDTISLVAAYIGVLIRFLPDLSLKSELMELMKRLAFQRCWWLFS